MPIKMELHGMVIFVYNLIHLLTWRIVYMDLS